jgi:3-deoxy-D-manno-octulosonate 8-phosphate phosphatase (KDO 8-P phosphatase)
MTYAQDKAKSVKLLALDVDGVLSDGRVYYSDTGAELKAFNIKDGLGIKLLQRAGITVAIITGRESSIVRRRAQELGIVDIIQGREDKLIALQELCDLHSLTLSQCAYMGDDLPDLAAINAAGLGLAVADACASVRAAAQWCSAAKGGEGAVREACEMILNACGKMAEIQLEFS